MGYGTAVLGAFKQKLGNGLRHTLYLTFEALLIFVTLSL